MAGVSCKRQEGRLGWYTFSPLLAPPMAHRRSLVTIIPVSFLQQLTLIKAVHFYPQPSSTMATSTADATPFYEDEKNLKTLCNFLRSNDGPAVREAIEMDKRVYYLKGKFYLTRVNLHFHHRLQSKFCHFTDSMST